MFLDADRAASDWAKDAPAVSTCQRPQQCPACRQALQTPPQAPRPDRAGTPAHAAAIVPYAQEASKSGCMFASFPAINDCRVSDVAGCIVCIAPHRGFQAGTQSRLTGAARRQAVRIEEL